MAKGKDVRIGVILECISRVRKGANEESTGITSSQRSQDVLPPSKKKLLNFF
jgi:large subunit ribosomal protein L33